MTVQIKDVPRAEGALHPIDRLVERAIRGFQRRRFRGEIYDYARSIWLGSGYLIPEDNCCRVCRDKGMRSGNEKKDALGNPVLARSAMARGGLTTCRHFEIETARQLIGPFKALLDPNVDLVMLLKAVQTLGSLVWDLTLHFLVLHSPFMRIKVFIDSIEKTTRYCDDRLMPTLKRNPDIAPMLPSGAERHDATKTTINFLNGKTIEILALNDSNASSLSADFVVIDEGWEHGGDGLMQKAMDRTKQARATGHVKVFIVGQAGNKDEDQDKIWQGLDKRVRATWRCPCCNSAQTFGEYGPTILRPADFVARPPLAIAPPGADSVAIAGSNENIRRELGSADIRTAQCAVPTWEPPKPGTYAGLLVAKKPSEIHSAEEIRAVAAGAWLECFHCGHKITDTKENRWALMESYDQEYREKDTATGVLYTPEHFSVGFWNPDPMSVTISFKETMAEYIKAKKADEDFKNKIPLRDFYQNRWATPWDENLVKVMRARAQEKYDAQSDWPEEWSGRRCLIVDCQYELQHFWASLHANSKRGKNRQLWRGLVRGFGKAGDAMPKDGSPPTLCAVQKHFGVLDQRVFLDAGYMKNELVDECAKHGHWGRIDGERVWLCWTLLVGSKQQDFLHKEDKNPKLRHPVSDAFFETPSFRVDGQLVEVEVFYFSKLQMSQMFARYRDGNGPETLFLEEQERPDAAGVYPPLSWTAQIYASTPHYTPSKTTGESTEIWRPEKQSTPHHYFDVGTMFMAVHCLWGISGHVQFSEPATIDASPAADGKVEYALKK